MLIKRRRGWEIPESEATPEGAFWNRREILRAAGFLGLGGLLQAAEGASKLYPARRNEKFTLDRPVTPEWAATGFNNYYEFHPTDKRAVKDLTGRFKTHPWTIEIRGQVNNPQKLDLDDLLEKVELEERLYRFRCVEAWSMAVPWTGFPMRRLIEIADPKPKAKYVRFVTANRPAEMPGMRKAPWYPWPYYEGLRLDEAANELTMLVTGVYGKPLPVQNGAPIRLIVPWKYGFKSIKSIVRIEFTAKRPRTFWNDVQPREYGFYANVDPARPHPRWSQATEKVIPNMEVRRTLPYNGYGEWVAEMYTGKEY